MVFSSQIFLFFFLPLVIIGYYLLKENYRLHFLLLASLLFYAWGEPRYIFVMLVSIALNYLSGLFIDKNHTNRILARILLIVSITGNLGILFYFKYLNFTIDSMNRFFGTSFVWHQIVLPIGISFFIFQGMSYVIDLYRRQVDVQKNPVKLAFYISFFPQLMAGPIVRYIDIKDQLYKREESIEKFIAGIQRFVIGLAKKVIIANNMGYVADLVFSNPAIENTPAVAWLGIICYAFQIYFDFSGYSDMAIGLAKLFGFEFRENFNYPYISKSITEFWRRWHISLSAWFRDYVYIPLGGNRKGNVYANLFFVFIVTGFWHGASFSFVVWGLWHGFALIIERLFGMRETHNKKLVPLRYVITMLIVLTGWVFFRSPGLRYALTYLGIMFGIIQPENVFFTLGYYINPYIIFMLCLAAVAATPVLKIIQCKFSNVQNTVILKKTGYVLISTLFLICVIFVTASSYNPFIYFRF